jgi:hypothetical protein
MMVSKLVIERQQLEAKKTNEAVHELLCAEIAKLSEEPPVKRVKTE